MELDLNKLRSLTEKVMIDKKFGVIPPPVPGDLPVQTQADVWKAGPDKNQDDNIIATIRSSRDYISQLILDALTDTDSTGASISVPNVFGGGSRIPGVGHALLKATTGKHVYLRAGIFGFRVTPTAIELTIDDGASWVNLLSIASGTIEWSPSAVYSDISWVSFQGKLYLSLYTPNVGKVPGINYPPPGLPLDPPVPWWLLFTERIGNFFNLPNVLAFGIPDGSITNIKISPTAAIDATKIANGSVSNSEFQFLDGVTSSIQPQLNSKASDSSVVHLTGSESVSGVKTFTSFPTTPSSSPTTDYQTANKKYVDDKTGHVSRVTVSSNYVATASNSVILVNASSGPVTVTLPTVSSSGDGKLIWVKKIDATHNKVTVDGNGSETIDSLLTIFTTNPNDSFNLCCDTAQWFVL